MLTSFSLESSSKAFERGYDFFLSYFKIFLLFSPLLGSGLKVLLLKFYCFGSRIADELAGLAGSCLLSVLHYYVFRLRPTA